MIYSDDIEKICALCVYSEKRSNTLVFCAHLGQCVGASDSACKRYKYDILKREVRRRRPLDTNKLSEEDFKL
ncbi:MAG TPA: hypothetical protein IAA60_02115 [Candidatus Ornithomonoglobus intestinigallinarum]|uniref:Uncharacterized protein n=1 Tax=Candidatus Ornithomonoglobus intestinigallinarum TaxID=2840894 RepID=A0A9D1H1M3_9FIRM|nr:hypothetical protein [Candidatus Ornithomonoglobus intestinigallinarum]